MTYKIICTHKETEMFTESFYDEEKSLTENLILSTLERLKVEKISNIDICKNLKGIPILHVIAYGLDLFVERVKV